MANAFKLLSNLRENIPADIPENQSAREKLLHEWRAVSLSLEREDNAVERISFQLLENASLPQTATDIAKKTPGADPTLVGEYIFHKVCVCRVNKEKVEFCDVSSHSEPLVEVLQPAPGWILLPQFLKYKNYQNPTSGTDTPFSKAYGFKDGATLWKILGTTNHMPVMALWMESFNDGHKNFLDIYPVRGRFAPGASTDSEAVLMVDIGGGQGHQAINMEKKVSRYSWKIHRDRSFSWVACKQGREYRCARLYYLRCICHDWPQAILIQILTHVRKAMTPGYSKAIINDWIVPAEGASKFMTGQDFNMMAIGGSMERTQALHEEFIAAAGLNISGIWKADDDISESVIECEIA
ncbi:hypothetical protein NHQ30_000609 [Ciborinia camelliae]|nr:hypothetical protein NHQ30_000609 [Ciborinia camelliae]